MSVGTQFDRLFDDFGDEAFRLETLPGYNVGADRERLAQFMSGAYLPEPPIPGVEFVQDLVRPGRRTSLVRLVAAPLTVEQRLSIEWVYPHHAAAGRDIWILEAHSPAAAAAVTVGDFWLFDSVTVAAMKYEPDGSFDRADVTSDPVQVDRYVALRNQLLMSAIPFRTWLAEWRKKAL